MPATHPADAPLPGDRAPERQLNERSAKRTDGLPSLRVTDPTVGQASSLPVWSASWKLAPRWGGKPLLGPPQLILRRPEQQPHPQPDPPDDQDNTAIALQALRSRIVAQQLIEIAV